MPPRKKPRLSSRAASPPSGDVVEHPTEPLQTPSKVDSTKPYLPIDLWSDEQETSLFKGMIRWKPVGMHKHFRMVAISQHLRNHGYTSAQDDHTRIPHIWEKLRKLYNLEALDERENFSSDSRSENNGHAEQPSYQFALPIDDFGEMMFEKRLKPEGSVSPQSPPNQPLGDSETGTRRPSTIDDTDEPRSSPTSIRGQKPTRGGSRGTRRSQLQALSIPVASRGASKASVDDITEDNENDDEAEGNEHAAKQTSRAVPKPPPKARKRRSTRRR